ALIDAVGVAAAAATRLTHRGHRVAGLTCHARRIAGGIAAEVGAVGTTAVSVLGALDAHTIALAGDRTVADPDTVAVGRLLAVTGTWHTVAHPSSTELATVGAIHVTSALDTRAGVHIEHLTVVGAVCRVEVAHHTLTGVGFAGVVCGVTSGPGRAGAVRRTAVETPVAPLERNTRCTRPTLERVGTRIAIGGL